MKKTTVVRRATKTTKKPVVRRTSPTKKRSVAQRRKLRPLHKRVLLHPGSIFAMLCIGILIGGLTLHSNADSYSVTASVPAPPLLEPAIITSPDNQATIGSSPLVVTGTCPANSYVNLTRNGYFSGTALCENSTFTIETDLSDGSNSLLAQDYNVTNSPGPTSASITVHYTASNTTVIPNSVQPVVQAANTPSSTSSNSDNETNNGPLLLSSQYSYQVFQTDQTYHWGLTLNGGTPPYQVHVSWGDGTTSDLIFTTDPTFTIEHHYNKAGNYSILVSAVDEHGYKVIMQLSADIKTIAAANGLFGGNSTNESGNGTLQPGQSTTHIPSLTPIAKLHEWLWVIWPSYAIVILMTISFWLGEREEYHHLLHKKRSRVRRV